MGIARKTPTVTGGERTGSARLIRKLIPLAVAGVLGLSACTNAPPSRTAARHTPSSPPLPSPNPTIPGLITRDPVVQVVRRVAPSVVNVTSRTVNPDVFGQAQIGSGVGTGFILRSDGIVVTNFHVVEGALNLKVTLPPPDGRTFPARVIGADSEHDLAVLKINGSGLPTVPLGGSSKLALGEPVIALGYALALPGGPTVTSGIISALGRTVQAEDPNGGPNGEPITRTYQDALQTDAAINPGNSGGPLVDLAGNVVGINTAGSQQAENIGFAIAIDAAKPIIERAMAHPSAPVAYMGVSTATVDAGVAAQFGLAISHGALVLALAPGGPAARTDMQVNDVIVEFQGRAIDTSDALGAAILARKPGDSVQVQLVHQDGGRETVSVILGVRPLP
jgi:S1-C subfamily serine protease